MDYPGEHEFDTSIRKVGVIEKVADTVMVTTGVCIVIAIIAIQYLTGIFKRGKIES